MTKVIWCAMIVIGAACWVPAAGAADPSSPPATPPSTQPAAAPSASAKYVTTDTTTQGYWKCVYGTDGYLVVGDAQKLPAYAKVAVTTEKGDAKDQYSEYILHRSSAADSALQKAEGSDRIVAHWGSYVGMTIDVNLTDNQVHRVALYCLNYAKPVMAQTIEVLDADTDTALATRKVKGFFHGQYLVWDIKGHVKIRVTSLDEKARAAVSGLFFGQRSAAPSASAKYVTTDTATQGNWKGVYGADGCVVVGDAQKLPDYAKLAVLTEKGKEDGPGDRYIEGVWSRSTDDVRALQKAEGADRIAVMWGSYRGMTFDVDLTDNQPHRLALYFLDFRRGNLSAKIEVLDADTCAVLDTRNMKKPVEGQYLVWDIKGHVRIRMTNTSEGRVPFCGLFFGPPSAPAAGAVEPSSPPAAPPSAQPAAAPGASVKYVTTDTTTQGTWKKVYGTDGYVVVGDTQSLPAYAKVTVITEKGELSKEAKNLYIEHTYSGSTTDVRALQKVAGTDRIAAFWGSYGGITIDVNLTDNQAHRIALYYLDWNKRQMAEKIEVLDAGNDAVLDTRKVKDFDGGQYLVWDIKGHVKLRLTTMAESRAVISGLFFQPPSAPAAGAGGPSPQPAAPPSTQPAKELTLDLGNKVTMKLVEIPTGKFLMGSPKSEKDRNPYESQHEVTISKPFYMGVYEVTQAQYEQVMGKNPSSSKYRGPTNPAGGMTWNDAAEFCKKLSQKTGKTVRLPTEAEWEYACRAGSTTRFYYGDDNKGEKLDDYMWYGKNSPDKTNPVGQKKPNAWGLYDMHGNVGEWVNDWMARYTNEKNVVDPTGPDSGPCHIFRGGCVYHNFGADQCRSAYRQGEEGKNMAHDAIGFRVAVESQVKVP